MSYCSLSITQRDDKGEFLLKSSGYLLQILEFLISSHLLTPYSLESKVLWNPEMCYLCSCKLITKGIRLVYLIKWRPELVSTRFLLKGSREMGSLELAMWGRNEDLLVEWLRWRVQFMKPVFKEILCPKRR